MRSALFLVPLVVLPALLAQTPNQNTVFQTLITSAAVSPTYSAPVRNIGQAQHIAELYITAAPGKTCGILGTFDAGFEASFDGTNYIKLGSPATGWVPAAYGGDDRVLVRGDGVYPYVRFALRAFDAVNCRASVKYSGSLTALTVESAMQDTLFPGQQKLRNFYHTATSSITTPTYTGTGLDDLTKGGTYSRPELGVTDFCVRVDSLGAADTFSWGIYYAGAGQTPATAGACTNGATGVAMTGAAQALIYGVTVTFGAVAGHALTDQWTFEGRDAQTVIIPGTDFPDYQILPISVILSCSVAQTVAFGEGSYPWFGLRGPVFLAAGVPLVLDYTGFAYYANRKNIDFSFHASGTGPCAGTIIYRPLSRN